MPYIPHTVNETQHMLNTVGLSHLDDLFSEIPASLRCASLNLPDALNEMAISSVMQQRAQQDEGLLCFAGAGAYDHYIPAAVWALASRGEFYTAYTPYQAEASQGTLQVLYEYQSMITALTAMDVANASLYDGASALAEAVLMAVRANRHSQSRKILIPRSLHPAYRKTVHSIVHHQQIELIELPFDLTTGQTPLAALDAYAAADITAVIIAQPNYFGVVEAVDGLTDWAQKHGALAIAVVNPMAQAVLKPAGQWGEKGVDICCGEGQPLGIPLSSGGPYFGFMGCKQDWLRQMPGRIVGRTVDSDGNTGYTLTLQAREQHIRRAKATSNICTNQGLMVTAATIYMALLGQQGLERVAMVCHQNAHVLRAQLTALPAIEACFTGALFHELAVRLPKPVAKLRNALMQQGFLAGVDLSQDYPELGNALLLCASEKRDAAQIHALVQAMAQYLA